MEILLDMLGREWEEVVLSGERKASRERVLSQYIPRFIPILYTAGRRVQNLLLSVYSHSMGQLSKSSTPKVVEMDT